MLFNLPVLQKLVVIHIASVHQGTRATLNRYSSAAERLKTPSSIQQDSQESESEDGYRLISGRSQDRNLLPVSINTSHRCIKALEQPKGTYGSPLTPPFKLGQGVRGDSMSPEIPCSAEEARRKTPSVTNKI